MTLAAEQGATLTLVVEGSDEEEAADALEELFDDGFGEEL
jgi:phosphocarrier protein